MPPRSKIDLLPERIRDELNRRLVGSAFGNLAGMREFLQQEGIEISTSTIGEYSLALRQKIEQRQERAMARIEIHKALGGMSDENKAALLESGEMAAYDACLDTLDELADMNPEERVKALPGMVRALADLSRSTVGTAKWNAQRQAEIRRAALDEAATAAQKAATKAGVSPDGIAAIRAAIAANLQ